MFYLSTYTFSGSRVIAEKTASKPIYRLMRSLVVQGLGPYLSTPFVPFIANLLLICEL